MNLKSRIQTLIMPQIPERWSRQFALLQDLHDQLLRNSQIQTSNAMEALEQHSMDMADSATDEFDHNLALGLLSHQHNALHEIRAAMRRILEGRYGICEETGEPIAEERLLALPWTRYTCEAQGRLERQGLNGRSRLGTLHSLHGFAADHDEAEDEEDTEMDVNPSVASRKFGDAEAVDVWLAAA